MSLDPRRELKVSSCAVAGQVVRCRQLPGASQFEVVAGCLQMKAVLWRSLAARWVALGLWLAMACVAIPTPARGDVLVATNGERFVGKVIAETADTIVFESELGGRLKLPRAQVRELQRGPTGQSAGTWALTNPPPPVTNQLSTLSLQPSTAAVQEGLLREFARKRDALTRLGSRGTTRSAAFGAAGFDSKPRDFSSALDEALSNPNCYKRWRHGKAAFSKQLSAKDWVQKSGRDSTAER